MNDNWFSLPPDTNKWQSVIIENLSKIAPEIPQYIAGFEMNQFDPVLGDGDGLIYLLNGIAAIPVTIRQFRLAPMDTMVTKNEDFYPVSSYFLQKAYADNVIGVPVSDTKNGDDNVEEGPARRIRHYQTVDQIKRASEETKLHLINQIEKSAKLVSFFDKNMPEVLAELHKPSEVQKEASILKIDLPNIHFLARENDTFYFNGEEISRDDVANFSKIASLTEEDRYALLNGGCVCLDYREKHSSIHINFDSSPSACHSSDHRLAMATVVDLHGVPHKGLFYRRSIYKYPENPAYRASQEKEETECVFITDNFYSVQSDMAVMDAVPIKFEHLIQVSEHSDPAVGDTGVIIDNYSLVGPFEVNSVQKHGNMAIVKTLNYGLENREYSVNGDSKFFIVPPNKKEVLRNMEPLMNLHHEENVSIGIDGDGRIVYKDKSYSHSNAAYALMDNLGVTFDDSLKIMDLAKTAGRVTFKLAREEDEADKKKNKGKNHDKGESAEHEEKEMREGTMEQEDVEQQRMAPQQPQADFPMFQTQPQQAQQAQQPMMPQEPVNTRDLENISALNDPGMMDAYLSGQLANVNTAGRDQIMQISDDLFESIKSLGKLLYLIRLGKIDYVKESDAMLAFNKLSDVSKNLGLSSSQLF